jgi:DNA-directed RNA polymerase subunit delta
LNYLIERVAYLKGLMDGLGIDDSTNEGKILINIIDVLDDIVDEIAELHDSRAELDEYVQTIDEDLSNIEDELYGQNSLDEDGDYSGKAQYIEVECPHCHDIVYFTDDIFDIEDELLCPNCNETIYDEEDNNDAD